MLNIAYPDRKKNIWVVDDISCTLSILSISSVSHFCKFYLWDKRFASLMSVSFLDGLVICVKWAKLPLKSRHSLWINNHVDFGVVIDGISSARSLHYALFQLSHKPTYLAYTLLHYGLRTLAEPAWCLTDAWYRLTQDKYVDTRGLAEDSPRQCLSKAFPCTVICVHGPVQVRQLPYVDTSRQNVGLLPFWNPGCH